MVDLRVSRVRGLLLGVALAAGAAVRSQQPAPPAPAAAPAALLRELADVGLRCLELEDPLRARDAFLTLHARDQGHVDGLLGLGRVHLMLGSPTLAECYAALLLRTHPDDQPAMALCVRALIRGRQFDAAVQRAERFLARGPEPGAELLAARASALFRVQRTDEAAAAYRRVLELDRGHAEAHLRLGSGLTPPTSVVIGPEILTAIAAARAGDLPTAIARLQRLVSAEPGNPVAHRLLGEALLQNKLLESMAAQDAAFTALRDSLPRPPVATLPIHELIAAYPTLTPPRRLVVDRAVALFGSRLPRLLASGARHDLLLEAERTTDEPARVGLRGRRTFDGRVWDDVRGVGGLRAATGIEALDEAAWYGFDTLAHELAHQVHYYGLPPVERARIREAYERARAEGRFLDYYAATNEAEYFGQGVEAFASFGKRPGCETTHGHTRFELLQVDRPLHDLIARLVDFDPLRDPAHRSRILTAAVAVALRVGRPDDAVVAAAMLDPGPERDRLLQAARTARVLARSY